MTPITPKSWIENATPPTWIGRVENALGNVFGLAAPDPACRPVQPMISPPSVTITIVSTGARSIGPDQLSLDRNAAEERDPERQEERPPVRHPPSHQRQAMKVENIAISPCAKLITRVER